MKSFLRLKRAQAIAALVMAIAILATLVGLGLSTSIARAASSNNDAQKVPLTTTNRNCDGTVTTSPGIGGGTGFAIINKAAAGKLISLGNGSANYQEAVIDGAKGAFVVLNNQADPGDDFYTTQVVNP